MKNTNVFRRLKIVNFSMHFIWSIKLSTNILFQKSESTSLAGSSVHDVWNEPENDW